MASPLLNLLILEYRHCQTGIHAVNGIGLIVSAPISSLNLYHFAYRTCKLRNMLPKKTLMSLPQFKCCIYDIDLVSLVSGH